MKLPESYIEKMKALLGEEADAYFASLDEERALGVRVNTLKCEPAAFEALVSRL